MKNWFKNLNILLLLCALTCVSNTVLGADCTYEQSFNNVSNTANGKWNSYKGFGTFTVCNTNSSLYIVSVSMNVAMDGSGWDKGFKGDLKASDGTTLVSNFEVGCGSNATCSANVNKSGISSISFETSNTYSKSRTVTITSITVTYRHNASLTPSESSLTVADAPVGGSSSTTFTVNYQNSTNSATLTATENLDANNFFSISPSSKSISDCSGSVTYTISFNPTSAVTNATASYTISGNGSSTSVSVTGTSFAIVDPVFTDGLGTSFMVGDPALDLESLWTSNNAVGDITYSVYSFEESGINNEEGTDPAVSGNRWLSLGKAGTVVVKMHQDASTGYNAKDAYHTITISKYTPVFTWNTGSAVYYYQSNVANIFGTNSPCDYTIVSNKPYSANVIDNTLYIYNVEETAEITITQEENYLWEGKVAKYEVAPVEQNNHVEKWITNDNHGVFEYASSFSSHAEWSNPGYRLGDGGWDTQDNYAIVKFTGIPDKLYFDKTLEKWGLSLPGTYLCEVYESTDGVNWGSAVWTHNERVEEKNGNVVQLTPTTRYIKFAYHGTVYCNYKNIHITELNQFSATPALVDFGTKGINFGTQEETVIFNHANAGRITTMEIVEGDVEYFSLERSTIPGTGRDLYATTNIVVSFDNKKGPAGHEPAYSAVLHIEDNAGHFLNIPLSGVRDGKTEPEFSFNANHLPYFVGTNIANVASSSNTDYANCPLTFETSDASIAQVIDGTLHIYNKKESVTITIRQGENKDFSAGVAYFTFTPRERPERAVPMQLVKSIYNEGTVEAGSKCKWLDDDGGCIRVGNNNAVVDDWIWYNSEKNFTIAFDGTPGRLSFEYKNTAWLVTPDADHYTYEVQESSDGGTWHTIWYTDATTTEWTAVKEVTLNPSTRYLRFSFSGNYWGFYRNINISELVGYKYLRAESDGRYLSRGALWGTQAIVDDFGMACRISNYTNDNTNFYTRFLFVDNQQYLYEADNHEMYTDDGTAANTYNLWKQNVVDGTIITFQSGNAYPGDSRKGQYITLNGDALALTADAAAATRWQMEDYTEHEAYITAMMDREAAAAAAKDFGSSINTLAKVRTEIAENDFEMTHIDIPALALGEQKGEYRSGVAGTNAVYDNTISGLVPGFYRLTVKAFYRISSPDIAWTCHAAGMESVLAYIYANSVEYPLQSLYNSYHVSPLEASDELRGGHYYSTDLTSAGEAFEDEKRYLNDVYVYVPADEGLTTGTLRYGIKNPSYVPGAWLTYKDITLTRIARKEYIFEGTFVSDKENWEVGGNWNRESVPNEHHAVIIRSDVVIGDEVKAYSLAIENDAKVIVAPTGGLTIGAGGVKGATKANLQLKVSQEGTNKGQTGYLRVSPYCTQPMPEATVELFITAYYNASVSGHQDIGTWQYIGSPMVGGTAARTVFPTSMLYDWSETTGTWKNNLRKLVLQPFTGYATSQYKENGTLITNTGQLVDNGTIVLPLTYTEESATPGCNVFANSFAAPIDITRLKASDFSDGVEASIHMFNAGSKADVERVSESKDFDVNAAGQYLSIPVATARTLGEEFGYPTIIPAMQGFYINTDKAGSLTLDYERLVWNADLADNSNKPLRVKAQIEDERPTTGSLMLTLYTEGLSDNVYVLESEKYDATYENGYDASKKMSCSFNVFTIEEENHLAVDATNSIIGTRVGVRTGDETAYTFVFGKMRSENELALFDAETSETIDINEGTEYTFFAEPNSMIMDRFQIVERDNAPAITTDIDNVENETKAHKFIKNNQLYILKNGVLYSATGAVVR